MMAPRESGLDHNAFVMRIEMIGVRIWSGYRQSDATLDTTQIHGRKKSWQSPV
jgi:hypothetical protein